MKLLLNTKSLIITSALTLWVSPFLYSQTDVDARIERLESMMMAMQQELSTLKAERDTAREQAANAEAKLEEIAATQEAVLAELEERPAGGETVKSGPNLPSGLRIGAYGEHHFGFTNTGTGSQSDVHRFVAFLGYEFADWISFVSETELEHGFVNGGNGEIVLEQFYMDFNLHPAANVRVGRALHPAGIINRFHEPTSFYGVERPTYSANILPSTYSIDGIGLWGSITEWLSYEAYVHAGLDGSNFKTSDGFRSGRLKERPGLESAGVSGRVDIQPLVAANVEGNVNWRVGASFSSIGVQNTNKGVATTADGDISIIALDTDLNIGPVDIRAEWANVDFSNPATLGGNGSGLGTIAEEISGWYVEGALHVFPECMKKGKFEQADLVPFVRYSEINLQDEVMAGMTPNLALNTEELTIGVNFYPVSNVVLKADYIFVDNEAGTATSANNKYNFGVGYDF